MKKIAVGLFLFVSTVFGFAQTPYEFTTDPYVHTQDIGACETYSGNSCIKPQQWGFIDIDPVARVMQMRSGIGKQGQGNQPPKTYILGDCWQSGSRVAASAGTRKWVLTTGTPEMCAASGCSSYFNEVPPGSGNWVCSGQPRPAQAVQIWKFESGNWVWKGQLGSDLFLYRRFASIRVVGDVGYVLESHNGIPTPPPVWSKMDLNALTIVQTGIPEASVPPGEAQPGINGVTWTLAKIDNPAKYRLSVIGPAPPTITPGGPTITVTKTATKTPTSGTPSKTPTLDPCGPFPNCKTNTPSPWRTNTPGGPTRTVTPMPPTPTPIVGACGPLDQYMLCLGNRYTVSAVWTKNDGTTGQAVAIPRTPDTGEFWFFSPSNIEMVIKVLDGCAINSHHWVFAGGLTNVKVDMTVTDTHTGAVQTFTNPQSTPFQPIQNTVAFDCAQARMAKSVMSIPPTPCPTCPTRITHMTPAQQWIAGAVFLMFGIGLWFSLRKKW